MAVREGSEDHAAIRARTCRDTLAYLEVFRAGARAEVERALPAAVVAAIESPATTGYVPLWADSKMGEAIVDLLGPEEALRFWVRYVTHHLDSPLLATTMKTALALFGTTPSGLIRWLPKILSLVFREAFEVRVELQGETAAEVRFVSDSAAFLGSRAYPIVLESFFRAIFVATGATGQVRVERRTAEQAYVVTTSFRV